MAVEIKELLIRVTVNETQPAPAGTPVKNGPRTGSDQTGILKMCLEQTAELLEQKKER